MVVVNSSCFRHSMFLEIMIALRDSYTRIYFAWIYLIFNSFLIRMIFSFHNLNKFVSILIMMPGFLLDLPIDNTFLMIRGL